MPGACLSNRGPIPDTSQSSRFLHLPGERSSEYSGTRRPRKLVSAYRRECCARGRAPAGNSCCHSSRSSLPTQLPLLDGCPAGFFLSRLHAPIHAFYPIVHRLWCQRIDLRVLRGFYVLFLVQSIDQLQQQIQFGFSPARIARPTTSLKTFLMVTFSRLRKSAGVPKLGRCSPESHMSSTSRPNSAANGRAAYTRRHYPKSHIFSSLQDDRRSPHHPCTARSARSSRVGRPQHRRIAPNSAAQSVRPMMVATDSMPPDDSA